MRVATADSSEIRWDQSGTHTLPLDWFHRLLVVADCVTDPTTNSEGASQLSDWAFETPELIRLCAIVGYAVESY